MKLQQLRYIWEVARHQLSITAAAETLFTSQPGISKQISQLEGELGVQIFVRNGRQLTELTSAGQAILEHIGQVLFQTAAIERIAADLRDDQRGDLAIATTHTQARYVLPPVIRHFIQRFPNVALHMHQGSPMQIAELAAQRKVDLAIATEAMEHFHDLVMLPCYTWNRGIICPADHPLLLEPVLTLEAVARYPIVTYVFGFTGRSHLDQAFSAHQLIPRVVFTATDADVIKTYVRLGLGVGIIANLAYDAATDGDLVRMDASALFEPSVTRIGIRRGTYLRGYMYEFIEAFAPHLHRDVVEAAMKCPTQEGVDDLFTGITLPTH